MGVVSTVSTPIVPSFLISGRPSWPTGPAPSSRGQQQRKYDVHVSVPFLSAQQRQSPIVAPHRFALSVPTSGPRGGPAKSLSSYAISLLNDTKPKKLATPQSNNPAMAGSGTMGLAPI